MLRGLDETQFDFREQTLGYCDVMDSIGDYTVVVPNSGISRSHLGDHIHYRHDTDLHDADFLLGQELSMTAPSSSASTTLYRFSQPEQSLPAKIEPRPGYEFSGMSSIPSFAHVRDPPPTRQSSSTKTVPLEDLPGPPPSESPPRGERDFLGSAEEVHYMQVFVEEIGVWMDSFDRDKHFSELIPYQALKSPMLLNSFLACGVTHISPRSLDKRQKALMYYNTATTQLLRNMTNPDRDMTECATVAVVLSVYEIMSDAPAQRMKHVSGARAIIRECHWDAKSAGIAGACFWLNIVMEVLNCLAMTWLTTWDPDHWGLDVDMTAEGAGDEQLWVQRIFYVVAKIANFRASASQFLEPIPQNEQIRLGKRLCEWQELKKLCDAWNNACPRTMHPMGYLYPTQSEMTQSLFPKIWYAPLSSHCCWTDWFRMIKREAVLGRLFYHTALCILAATHPMEPATSSEEMRTLQLHHAHQVCGIVAHSSDRGIASTAVRALAIAAPALVDHDERTEALELLRKINTRSGWCLSDVEVELKRAWH